MAAKRSSDLRPRKRRRIDCPEITEWMRLVETGGIEACAEQHQLVAHVRHVFATEDLTIDYGRIERYMGYQKYFPFDLLPWEKFCFTLFMCVFKADGTPRWDEMFIYVGRGAGKNGFDGFVAFCAITNANGIGFYDVDICANSEEQAKTSFDDVYNVLEDPDNYRKFQRSFTWNQVVITSKSTKSRIKYRTDNPKSKDGLRSGMVIFDEVHAYENWKNINVFTTGLGKKPHPRRLYTTTDGDVRDGVLDSLKGKSKKILSGEKHDNGFLPFMCKLDRPEEVNDPRNWEKANPSLPYLPILRTEIEKEYADYVENPAVNFDFMTKRMNCPVAAQESPVAKWEDILATNRDVPELYGWPCICGIDFAKTNDFVAAVLLFRDGGQYYAICHTWVCRQSADLGRIKAPLDEWEAAGLLEFVDDVEVSPWLVTDWIIDQMRLYDVMRVSIDSYRFSLLKRELEGIGFDDKKRKNIKLVRPSDIMLVQVKINSLFLNQSIAWGDNPLMRWYTNNAKLVPAAHGNFTYGKIEEKSRKTDGFMAFVAAMTQEGELPECNEIEFIEPLVV